MVEAVLRPEAMGPVLGEVMSQTDALLFGRRTWDVMASAWPERAGDPFADQMNAIPKYVLSRTLRPRRRRPDGTTRRCWAVTTPSPPCASSGTVVVTAASR